MNIKVHYEFKKDKLGRAYALRVDLKTGKKERIGYELAETRQKRNISERKRTVIKEKLKTTGTGATYKEYLQASKVIEKEIADKRIAAGKKPLKKSAMRGRVKQKAIHERTGIATRFRFMWIYKIKLEYISEDTKEIEYICDSPAFTTAEHKTNGNDFEGMKTDCIDAYNEIKANKLCALEGGACVILYNKSDKSVIDQYEIGEGCGFAFSFKDSQGEIIYELEDGYYSGGV